MTIILVIPFFLSMLVVLYNRIDIHNLSIISLLTSIVISALTSSSSHLMATRIIHPSGIEQFWIRVNHILLSLGGFLVPLSVMDQWPSIGFLIRLNPFIYMSEGIKYALLQSHEFLFIKVSVRAFLIFTIVFIKNRIPIHQKTYKFPLIGLSTSL